MPQRASRRVPAPPPRGHKSGRAFSSFPAFVFSHSASLVSVDSVETLAPERDTTLDAPRHHTRTWAMLERSNPSVQSLV